MEYEIGDDPQGLPDQPDGDRDGGLRDKPVLFRKNSTVRRHVLDEDSPLKQLGEVA